MYLNTSINYNKIDVKANFTDRKRFFEYDQNVVWD
jgi:hypothetical protein